MASQNDGQPYAYDESTQPDQDESRDTVADHLPTRPWSEIPPSAPTRNALAPRAVSHQPEQVPFRGAMSSATKSQSGYMDADIKNFLKRHLRGTIHRDCPIDDFVDSVWHFNFEKLKAIRKTFTLSADLCNRYEDTAWKDPKKRGERHAMVVFTAIWNDIVRQLKEADEADSDITFVNMNDREVLGVFAKLKPDGVGLLDYQPLEPVCWDIVLSTEEMKKPWRATHLRKVFGATDIVIDLDIDQAPKPATTSNSTSKRKREDEHNEEDTQYRKRQRPSQPLPFAFDSETWYEGKNVSELTGDELQLVKYLNEMLSHGVRTHASGFLLKDSTMTLWSADRMGVITSVAFDIFAQPHYLILLVAAHHFGGPHDFGINPLVELPGLIYDDPSSSSSSSPADDDNKDANYTSNSRKAKKPPPRDIARAAYHAGVLTLPSATPAQLPAVEASPDAKDAFDTGEVPPLPAMAFEITLDESRHINTAYGIVGRGTTVIPVLPRLSAFEGLQLTDSDARYVAKLTFPLEARHAEDKYIRVIRRKLNEDEDGRSQLKHIADLLCSFHCKADDPFLDLPRAKLGLLPTDNLRCFRVLIMPEYLPLECISGPKDLQKIMIDVITGHHWVWKTSYILHRDISYGNIMFYVVIAADGTQQIVGVLTDWDLAEELPSTDPKAAVTEEEIKRRETEAIAKASQAAIVGNTPSNATAETTDITARAAAPAAEAPTPSADTTAPPAGATDAIQQAEADDAAIQEDVQQRQKVQYRTGTGPFMALDLLQTDGVPAHEYRHDLESFFWVLTWFCAVFNPENPSVFGDIPTWQKPNLVDVGHAKTRFLKDPEDMIRVMASTSTAFSGFVDTWICDLSLLFSRSMAASEQERMTASQYTKMVLKMGGKSRRDRWSRVIIADWNAARVRSREIVSFESVMAILNDPDCSPLLSKQEREREERD
ncbi:hypothetical protein EIP91_005389 [Steccherinum ochraceum]|uniref:Fungal-type protein kinase domain-containing protein n=1 Tax=Steccherinum ochraceum TaxID=92696 RepID=A0A4R0RI60_9APHY|nr:hypothetical protein EIP91_005389 [Steccherinum ochraceum]